MSKKASSPASPPSRSGVSRLLGLTKLKTSEDDEQAEVLDDLTKVDVYARQILLSGVLLTGEEGPARLDQALDALDGTPDDEEAPNYRREEWAYRIGLMTGLRLARGIAPTGGAR